jgi:hypothetical protein
VNIHKIFFLLCYQVDVGKVVVVVLDSVEVVVKLERNVSVISKESVVSCASVITRVVVDNVVVLIPGINVVSLSAE